MGLIGFGPLEGEQRMAPAFELASGKGKTVKLWDYKQRNSLVIYFVEGNETSFLPQLQTEYVAYRRNETELLVIAAQSPEMVASLTENLSLTYPLLADPDYATHAKYMQLIEPQYDPSSNKDKPVALFIADRYGSVYRYATSHIVANLPEQGEILSFLEFLGNLCNP